MTVSQPNVREYEFDSSTISEIRDLATDDAGNVYISDEFNHRILKYDKDLKPIASFGKQGSDPGEFHYPSGLEIIGGRLFVADAWNHRIQILSLEGEPRQSFGQMGQGLDDFLVPVDIKVGPKGRLWVLDSDNHAIKIFDADSLQRLKTYVGGKDNSIELMWNNETPVQTGLPIYYPKQIRFIGETAYIQDMDKITRIGPELIDDFRFEKPRGLCPIMTGTVDELVLFDRHMQRLITCNFVNLIEYAIAKPRQPLRTAMMDRQQCWLFSQTQGHCLPQIISGQQNEASDWLDWLKTPQQAQSRALNVSSIPDGVKVFESYLDEFENTDGTFRNDGREAICTTNPETRINPSFILDSAKGRIQDLELFLRRFINQQAKVANQFLQDLEKAHPSDRQNLVLLRVEKAFHSLAKLVTRQQRTFEVIGSLVSEPDNATLTRIDGCLFLLKRFIRLCLKVLRLYSERVKVFVSSEDLGAAGIIGFFFSQLPKTGRAAEIHLLTCLHRHRPDQFKLPNNARDALLVAWPSLEKAAIALAHQKQQLDAKTRRQHETQQLVHTLRAEQAQIFYHDGQLHHAFGFPINIQNLLLFAGNLNLPNFGETLHRSIYESDLKNQASLRKAAGVYQALQPDLEKACHTFQDNVSQLEKYGRVYEQPNRATLNPDYVFSVVHYAYNLALTGNIEAAFECLERINDHAEYYNTRAKIFIHQGEYDKALSETEKHAFWRLKLTQLLIFLETGHYQEALGVLADPPQGFPAQVQELYPGIIYRSAREFDLAEKHFSGLEQKHIQTLAYQRGILYRMMNQPEQALVQFQKQALLCPMLMNSIDTALTLKKLGQHDAYCQQLKNLPPHAFISWQGQRITPESPLFDQVTNQFLEIEATPYPAKLSLPHAWVSQAQTLGTMYFLFQEPFLNEGLQPIPAALIAND